MTFDECIEHCKEKPNGTYDLVPFVDAHFRIVEFRWGNSLRLSPLIDKETKRLQDIVGKEFTDVHPNRIRELMLLPTVVVKGSL